jgi:hypothetical protein
VTQIKLMIVSLIFAGCGNNIEIKNNKLESIAPLSSSQIASYQKSGTLQKGSITTIFYQGRTYNVSIYSSKAAQDFIKDLPSGSQVPVYFTGGSDRDQMVLETIKKQ